MIYVYINMIHLYLPTLFATRTRLHARLVAMQLGELHVAELQTATSRRLAPRLAPRWGDGHGGCLRIQIIGGFRKKWVRTQKMCGLFSMDIILKKLRYNYIYIYTYWCVSRREWMGMGGSSSMIMDHSLIPYV